MSDCSEVSKSQVSKVENYQPAFPTLLLTGPLRKYHSEVKLQIIQTLKSRKYHGRQRDFAEGEGEVLERDSAWVSLWIKVQITPNHNHPSKKNLCKKIWVQKKFR